MIYNRIALTILFVFYEKRGSNPFFIISCYNYTGSTRKRGIVNEKKHNGMCYSTKNL